ncbi:hypothetical protein FC07_GL000620 [Loigolactobacillus bifermentans DSM 20003]|uniref:DUF5067 domain-containing protein n=2 Tax=Loigolactobacillus bifermentans TaxID=1607 RepID=A0A0R1GK75_9LACO|nr:hypothetical protein FC07_GL000620 [Loigolactobacillus bifermentans DSM 20003]
MGLLGVGIVSLSLAGCSNSANNSGSTKDTAVKLTKQDLRDKYANTSDAQANAYNAMLDNAENKISDSEYSTKLQTALEKINKQNENLDATSTNKSAARDLKKFNDFGADTIIDLKNNNGEEFNKDAKAQTKVNNKVRPEINAPHPANFNKTIKRWHKYASNQPHTTKNSIVTPDYTITITKTETTPHFESGTDLVIYYDFKNTSSDQNIEPEDEFMNGEITQENDTSIVTLNTGNPDNSDPFASLEEASQQKVKPGATVQCAIDYELDNSDNVVKMTAKDENLNKIGSLTIWNPND